MMTREQLYKEILKLSLDDQAELAHAILHNIEEKPTENGDFIFTKEEKEKLNRRIEKSYRAPYGGSSWEEIQARVAKQYA